MMELIWVSEAVLLGCLAVWAWSDLRSVGPRWARALLIFGAGAAGGIGLTSCLYFVFGALLGVPLASMAVEFALLGFAGYTWYSRRSRPAPATAASAKSPMTLPVAAALVLAVAIATGAMSIAWEANPNGDWDAWGIWNLRARFLASGALAERAWSPVLAASTHPEYPLLLSGFVGRCWAFSGTSSTAPQATSYVFFLSLLALAGGGLAALRGPTLGLLAALCLAGSPPLLHEAPSLYSDLPLACYFAGAVLFALLDKPLLAGASAGFAAWTKNEGLLFLVLFMAAIALWKRTALRPVLTSVLPPAILVAIFKLTLSPGGGGLFPTGLGQALGMLADAGRYGTILSAFAREFAGMATGFHHPVLPLLALAIALRFDRERHRDVLFCGALTGMLLVGYFAVYLLTPNELQWQLDTSLGRLLVQVWPILVVTAMAALRPPEATAIVTVSKPAKSRKKAR